MITKYNIYIKESLLDKLKGPSKDELVEDIQSSFKSGKIPLVKYIKYCEIYDLELPTVEEIKRNYGRNGFSGINQQELLQNSIINSSKGGIDIALELGADIDFLGTPLFYAIHYNKYDMLKYLVEKGANVNVKNGSPLTYSAKKGRINFVKYLLKMGADVHGDNDAALFYTKHGDKPNLYKLLKDHADKTPPFTDEERFDKCGYYKLEPNELLRFSSETGFLYGVKKALDNHASRRESDLIESFSLACRSNNSDVIKYFIFDLNLDLNKLHKSYIDMLLRYSTPEIKEIVKNKYIKND